MLGRGQTVQRCADHIPGPLRHISVGLAGVCLFMANLRSSAEGVPAEEDAEEENAEGTPAEDVEGRSEEPCENSMKCWGKGIKSVINMKEVGGGGIDDMGKNNACGVTMNSELVCWGRGKEVANLPHGLVVA